MTKFTGVVPNKALILTGKGPVGKSLLMNFIAEGHKKENTVVINGRRKKFFNDKFLFREVTPKTSLILIDDVVDFSAIDLFKQFIPSGHIVVERKGKVEVLVSTKNIQFVFTTEIPFDFIIQDNSVNRRFHVIDLKALNHSSLYK